MPLTPADIQNVEIGKASLARRGYDEEQVDALLDEVTQEMIKLLEENDILRRRADRANASIDEPAASGAAVEAELSAVTAELDRARRACDRAEQNARHVRRQLDRARQAAAGPATIPGGESTDRVMTIAQRTADDHLRDAYQRSQALLADARERSERMVREARDMVSDIEHDAHRHLTETNAGLQAMRIDLQREIDQLARFAESYRGALATRLGRAGR